MTGGGLVPWRALLAEAERELRSASVPSPDVDAWRITEEASGLDGAELLVHLDEPATVRGVARFDRMLARRRAGEPLQHVLGRWGFRTLDLLVDRRALIPRPETEHVVHHALVELDRAVSALGRGAALAGAAPVFGSLSSPDVAKEPKTRRGGTVVDLGTGTGCIALSIAVERPGTSVWATDRSADALELARANLAGTGRAAVDVRLAAGDWYAALPGDLRGRVDVVVSNPPYVAAAEPLDPVVADWEPTDALVPGPTGLEAIEVVVAGAPEWLAPAGALVVEIGAEQGRAAAGLARAAGFTEVEVRPDLAGRDRCLVARAAPAGRKRRQPEPA
ncbi:MAG: peptide chain release factor N(5)-glutamine methyltransferase [Actinobacteria bacterium]|nr:peptide chain release factor N(5)-glutamine methyltransferase [Actinomycetota bacterium]